MNPYDITHLVENARRAGDPHLAHRVELRRQRKVRDASRHRRPWWRLR
jgi:hypothetical protein